MGKWFWLVVAAGVLWYLSKREEVKVKTTTNSVAAGAIQHGGNAVNNLIDSGSAALGRFIGSLGSGSSSNSSSSGSSAWSSGAGSYYGDPSEYVEEFDYSS